MLRYVRTGLLTIAVVTGVLLPITHYAPFAWIAGRGLALMLVLGHPATMERIEPGKDQPPGRLIQR